MKTKKYEAGNQMGLTRQSIQEDIRGFELREAETRERLASLLAKAGTFKERQKFRTTRNKLMAEVEHVGRR